MAKTRLTRFLLGTTALCGPLGLYIIQLLAVAGGERK